MTPLSLVFIVANLTLSLGGFFALCQCKITHVIIVNITSARISGVIMKSGEKFRLDPDYKPLYLIITLKCWLLQH